MQKARMVYRNGPCCRLSVVRCHVCVPSHDCFKEPPSYPYLGIAPLPPPRHLAVLAAVSQPDLLSPNAPLHTVARYLGLLLGREHNIHGVGMAEKDLKHMGGGRGVVTQ